MNSTEQQRYNELYQQHLTNLSLQGKRPSTIDAYARAIRRITTYFDRCPDTLSFDELKHYFAQLIQDYSWSTVKLYLSRYLYRGVLPDKDIVRIEQDNVTFRYRDSQTGPPTEAGSHIDPCSSSLSAV